MGVAIQPRFKDGRLGWLRPELFLPDKYICGGWLRTCFEFKVAANRRASSSYTSYGLLVVSSPILRLNLKAGAKGGVARQAERTVTAAPVEVEVVDTIGAGDSFNAGFLYGYLNGWALPAALRLACACGSLSARGVGGTDCQPTLDEAQRALATATKV